MGLEKKIVEPAESNEPVDPLFQPVGVDSSQQVRRNDGANAGGYHAHQDVGDILNT